MFDFASVWSLCGRLTSAIIVEKAARDNMQMNEHVCAISI